MPKQRYDSSDGLNGSLFAPNSAWVAPKSFPDLHGEKIIGIDTETNDPGLEARGPGFIRGDAFVAGVSIATADKRWYFPIKHLGGGNVNRDGLKAWLRDLLKSPSLYVVGANLQYDLEGLEIDLGIDVSAKCLDIQLAEALLNEESYAGYELDTLSRKYLGAGKDETLLRSAAEAYGVHPKSGLWKLPAKYVGPYAEFDAQAPVLIFREQIKKIQEENLQGIFELECKLLPILWKMRKRGIPVDLEKASELSATLLKQEGEIRDAFYKEYGCRLDEWSGPMLASLCDRLEIYYPRTPKGNPSFEGEFLEKSGHPVLKKVSDLRELNRLRTTFIDKWIFENQVDGWVHPSWKQLKCEDGGTRTGRMAASNPNPQQVPGRSELAPLVRAIFRSPTGKWAKLDYSQQEPRLLVHFASLCKCTGADLVKMAYRNNPKMDIYQFLADSCNMKRRDAKDATLGRMYGMGFRKFAKKQGIQESEAQKKLEDFDRSVPFVREISDMCMDAAQTRGYIKTLLGRRRHFELYEPSRYSDNYEYCEPLPLELAKQKWPKERLRRFGCHKALNALIQGSAADMTKAAMVKIWEEHGTFPYMQVHDELDFGVQDEAEALKYKLACEECVKLEVPIVSELYLGNHWK